MAVACIGKRGGLRFAPLLCLFAAGMIGAATPATAFADDEAAEAATPAPRWVLPPANVARRGALLGRPSRMAQLLVSQGSIAPTASVVSFGDTPAVTVLTSTVERRLDIATSARTPNVFGSVALAIGGTPLDAQWQRAGGAGAPGALGRWTGRFARPDGANTERVLDEVNRWVNTRLAFTDDSVRQGDIWASAEASLSRGRGDCEDYAIAKMQLLSALGLDRDVMFLVIVRDLVRRADHAVLVVQVGGRFLVLDNMTDAVLDSNRIADYRPVMSYSAGRRWLHGYARAPTPVQMASAPQTFTSVAP